MFCINCGSRVGDNDKFCMHCGTRIEEIGTDNSNINIDNKSESDAVIVDSNYRNYNVESDVVNVIDDYADSDSDKDSDNDLAAVIDSNEVYSIDVNDSVSSSENISDEVSYVIDDNQFNSMGEDNEVVDYYETTDDASLENESYEYEEVEESAANLENTLDEEYSEPVLTEDIPEEVSDIQYDSPVLEEVAVQDDDTTPEVAYEVEKVEEEPVVTTLDSNEEKNESSDYISSDYIVKPEIMSTFNEPIGVGITNSDFDVFGPENNSYNDLDVFNSRKNVPAMNENNRKVEKKDATIPKTVDVKYFIALLIILVAIAVALLIIIFLPETDDVNEPTPSSSVVDKVSSNKVAYKNFLFDIPEGYEFAVKNDVLLIGDKDNKWGAQIEVANGSYEQLGSKISQLTDVFEEKDFNSTKPDVRTEGGVEFITMEVKASDQNVLFALSQANSTSYFGISLINTENNIDYYLLEKIAPIVKSAKDVSSSKIIANNNVFAEDFESLAK